MEERTALTPSVVVKKFPAKADLPRPLRRGKWLKRGLFGLLMLALVAMSMPTILCSTLLRRSVPKMVVPMLHANIEWSELSLGWLSPIVIKNVKVEDQEGHPLLEVQQISTDHPLWALIAHSNNLGTLKIVEPVLHVSLRNDGSNLEDLIAKFSDPSKPPQTPEKSAVLPSVIVEIENARIELDHKESKRQSSLEQIAFRVVSNASGVEELDLTIGHPPASGQAATAGETANDWLVAHYGNQPPADAGSTTPDTKHAMLRASGWKLDWLVPALSRVMPKAELAGELNADTTVALTSNPKGLDWDWNGTLSIDKLLVSGIDALKRDTLALDQVELSGRAATTNGRLAMNDLKVSADVGELSATGDFPLDGNSKKSTAELVQSLISDEDYHVTGQIDLKKLAAMLPQTLRIQDGVEITSGDDKVQLVCDDATGVRRWSGVAGIVGLTAENKGKTIPWNKPLVARMKAHRDKNAIVVDQLECKSDFLQVTGSGTIDDAHFNATGDLDKLLENLEQFVDLGLHHLSGQMQADGELRRVDAEHVALIAKITLNNFACDVSKDNVWHEDHLELSVNASGLADTTSGLTQIDSAELHLISGGDSCDSRVTQPIDLKSKTPSYAVAADVKGNLATWQNRLKPFVAINGFKLGGTLDLETTVTADSRQVDLRKFTIVVDNLEVDGPGLVIHDPEVTLETAGVWGIASQKWTSPKSSLVGHALSVEIDNLECALGKNGIARLVAEVDYEADLKQVSHWMNLATEKPSYYLVGMLTGKANITQQDNVMTAKLDTMIDKLVIAGLQTPPDGQPTWSVLWKEPQVKVAAVANYDVAADTMSLDSSSFDVSGLSVGAKGTLTACATKQQIDLTGDIAYDWDLLIKRFGENLTRNVQLSGKDHRPFSVKGSLASLSSTPASTSPSSKKTNVMTLSFSPDENPATSKPVATAPAAGLMDFSAQAGLGWTAADVYGIVAGPGDVSVKLDKGICQFAPLDIAVNEGRMHLTPSVHLESDPALLVLPQEKMIDQIRLSPELCAGWLKFVVPALADSAQVEGKFSLDMQGASLPLSAPATGTVDARLSVHQVQVRPGPLALKIVGAIDQVQSIITRRSVGDLSKDVWLEMPEQHIPFKMEQGRVHHEGMTFTVKNVAVKTSGSVGTDETLDLIAEIPIQNGWLGNNKVFASLKGQSVRIPIRGTLTSPQLDPSIFSKLTEQLGGSVLEGVLQDQVGGKLDGVINDGLNRFFKGKK